MCEGKHSSVEKNFSLALFNNYSPKAKRILSNICLGDYSTIFIEPNCSGDYQSNCIFFHFTCFFFKNINKSRGGHFENSCSNIIITSRGVIIARYDVILDQSERAHLCNHRSNYTNYG